MSNEIALNSNEFTVVGDNCYLGNEIPAWLADYIKAYVDSKVAGKVADWVTNNNQWIIENTNFGEIYFEEEFTLWSNK
jgi:hypothetical protein